MDKLKEPTLKEFISSLNHVAGLDIDARFKMLLLQLYAEHYTNEIVLKLVDRKNIGKEVTNEISFVKKLAILKRIKVIDNKAENVLTILSGLRNLAVHQLLISEEEINTKLTERKLGFKYKINIQDKEFINLDLEKVYKDKKISKFSQLEISSILIIAILYSKLRMINSKSVDSYIHPKIKKDKDGKYVVDLKLVEKIKRK